MSFTVDHDRAEVHAKVAGLAESRAVYRSVFGSVNATGGLPVSIAAPVAEPAIPALLADIAGPPPVETADPALKAALDHVLEETAQPPRRNTQAVALYTRTGSSPSATRPT